MKPSFLPSFLTTALALGSSAADATTAAIELKPINLLFSQPSHRRSGNSGDLPAWLLISPRIPPSAVVGHVVPVICCRRENFFPKTFPYYEN